MGGKITNGMKLKYNPDYISIGTDTIDRKVSRRYHNHQVDSKEQEYTFIQLVEGKGVAVKERDIFIGTTCLYIDVDLKMS